MIVDTITKLLSTGVANEKCRKGVLVQMLALSTAIIYVAEDGDKHQFIKTIL